MDSEFKRRDGCCLVRWTEEFEDAKRLHKKRKQNVVESVNDQYGFELRESKAPPFWAIKAISQRVSADSPLQLTNHMSLIEASITNELLCISMEYLPEMIQGGLYQVTKVNELTSGIGAMIEVEVVAVAGSKTVSANKIPQFEHVTVVLDANRYWCLLSFLAAGRQSPPKSGRVMHRGNLEVIDSDPPKLRSSQVEIRIDDKIMSHVKVDVIANELKSMPSMGDFPLTAFGLPEPPGESARTRSKNRRAGVRSPPDRTQP